jgi:uncharacterized membrane protein YphA (DoxX/SURF4 family)
MKAFIPSIFAEIVFALILLVFAFNHFMYAGKMAGMASFMPGDGKIWVYLTGTVLLISAIAIITGIQKTPACYLLAAMLLVFVFTLHIKSFGENPAGTLKDTAMAMCAILIGNRKS